MPMPTDKYINIVYYSQTIDNYGHTESSSKGDYIYNALMNTDEWTDDMVFEDAAGNKFFIHNLAGETICIPSIGVFTVPTDNL